MKTLWITLIAYKLRALHAGDSWFFCRLTLMQSAEDQIHQLRALFEGS